MEQKNQWIYVIVLSPEKDERLYGFHHPEKGEDLIPFFRNREEATGFVYGLHDEITEKYEIQAFLLEELAEIARQASFLIAPVDGRGRIIQL